ncbi:MAG: phosphopyruvate hydratase [Candidatus Micrarchaeota archaeon]
MAEKITKVFAREIIDSRGNPTIEVDVYTKTHWARASAPSGASTGTHEALELRDGEKRFNGKGVRKAVANVNGPITKLLLGMDPTKQTEIDNAMLKLDGTPNKSKLGGNAMVAVSMAIAKLGAAVEGVWLYEWVGEMSGRKGTMLPVPFMNILNGGKHAGGSLSIQEFMVVPAGAKSFSEALQMGCEVYHALGKIIVKKYGVGAKNVGDEGGFAPSMKAARESFDAISEAIKETGYDGKVFIGVDSASSSFYDEKKATYMLDGKETNDEGMLKFYEELANAYPIVSLEDPFFEEDFAFFAKLNKKIGNKAQIVADDLTVTDPIRVKKGLSSGSMSCLLLKLNQIGTVTEALEAARMMFDSGNNVMVSHRSGETDDCTISDLVVGIASGQLKTGAPARGERIAKYNQLLRIEEHLGKRAKYAGRGFRS